MGRYSKYRSFYRKLGNRRFQRYDWQRMDQYKKLTVNTLILTLGTVGSKVISLLMLPFYTNILTTAEFGTIDLLLQTANFLIPVCTIGITAAIIRFGLDTRYKKRDVLTTGLLCYGFGFLLCILLSLVAEVIFSLPVARLSQVQSVKNYVVWVLLLIAASSLHSICGAFVRAEQKIRIYAITGLLNTICTILLMILFLKVFGLGIGGYMMAVVIADVFCALFLAVSGKLWRFVSFRNLRLATTRAMIKFSAPLIPATISWWIINLSDRFMIWLFIGASANGIYSVAAKIPLIVTLLAGVFMEAWQVSIIVTKSKQEQTAFFSNIMRSYQSLLFVMAGGVTLFSRFIITFLTSPDFYEAWLYVPLLLISTVFSCLATFVGSIYTVEKKSVAQLITTLIGAASNILLNFILIPIYGIAGAAIATLASFMLVFVIRLIDTRKYIVVHWSPVRFCVSLALLLIQLFVMVNDSGGMQLVQAICLAGLLAANFNPLLTGVKKIVSFRR